MKSSSELWTEADGLRAKVKAIDQKLQEVVFGSPEWKTGLVAYREAEHALSEVEQAAILANMAEKGFAPRESPGTGAYC